MKSSGSTQEAEVTRPRPSTVVSLGGPCRFMIRLVISGQHEQTWASPSSRSSRRTISYSAKVVGANGILLFFPVKSSLIDVPRVHAWA